MNEATRQAYVDKMNGHLKEWTAKFEVLKAKGSVMAADVKIEYNKKIEDWQKKELDLHKNLDELCTAGLDRFETMKSGIERTWTELKTAIETTTGDKK